VHVARKRPARRDDQLNGVLDDDGVVLQVATCGVLQDVALSQQQWGKGEGEGTGVRVLK
jgi:hypothetical protein